MTNKPYLQIISHYEACLRQFGDTHRGVDWPSADDADTRYRVMLDVVRPTGGRRVSLLDFGCGASHLYEYMLRHGYPDIEYSGLDLSPTFIALCRAKLPAITYYCLDILDAADALPSFDYIIMNGVLTEKRGLSQETMDRYVQNLLPAVFQKARQGIAFNVMSKHVDWERDDLYHVSIDRLTAYLAAHLSRHFVIRHDYRLYEYTVYLYR